MQKRFSLYGAFLIAAMLLSCNDAMSYSPAPPPVLENLIHEGHYQEAIDFLNGKRPQYAKPDAAFPLAFYYYPSGDGDPWQQANASKRKAEIYFIYLKDTRSAFAEIENALRLLPDGPDLALLELKADIEAESQQLAAALKDYSTVISRRTIDSDLLPKLSVLKKRARIEKKLGLKKEELDDLKLVNLYSKELSLRTPSTSYISASLSDEEFKRVLDMKDPFDLQALNAMSLRKTPYFHYERQDKAATIQIQLEEGCVSRHPFKAEKLIISETIPSELYCFPWGYLDLISSLDGKKSEYAILRTPGQQFASMRYTSSRCTQRDDYSRVLASFCKRHRSDRDIARHYIKNVLYTNRFERDLLPTPEVYGVDYLIPNIMGKASSFKEALKYMEKMASKNPAKSEQDKSFPTLRTAILLEQKRFVEADKLSQDPRFGNDGALDSSSTIFLKAQIRAGLKNYAGAAALLKQVIPKFYSAARINDRDKAQALLAEMQKKQGLGNDLEQTKGAGCADADLLILTSPAGGGKVQQPEKR